MMVPSGSTLKFRVYSFFRSLAPEKCDTVEAYLRSDEFTQHLAPVQSRFSDPTAKSHRVAQFGSRYDYAAGSAHGGSAPPFPEIISLLRSELVVTIYLPWISVSVTNICRLTCRVLVRWLHV